MSDPKVGFGDSQTWTPFHPSGSLLSSDALVSSILKGAQGGQNTQAYFDQVNAIGQLYKKVALEGDAAWTQGKDENNNPVQFVAMEDSSGNAMYMKLAVEGLQVDPSGNVVPNGDKFTLNGIDFEGMGVLVHTVGYSNFTFSQTSRKVGVTIGGGVAAKFILPYVWNGMKTIGRAIANGIQKLWQLARGSGQAAADDVAANAANDGERALAEGGVEVEAGAVEAAGIAAGTVLVAVAIVLAIAFIVISFILHNSYHCLRIWNITRYNMDWSYWIDTEASSSEGQLISGPGVAVNGKIQPTTIPAASAKGIIPGVQGTPHASYGDIQVVSSHEYNGIGYALQLSLKDTTTGNVVYTITVYYDIPFSGDNSTNLTFDAVSEVGKWYKNNQGNHKSNFATAKSKDSIVVASSSYDFLNGQHPVPSQQGGSSNEAYYYQSLLVVEEPNLKVSDID